MKQRHYLIITVALAAVIIVTRLFVAGEPAESAPASVERLAGPVSSQSPAEAQSVEEWPLFAERDDPRYQRLQGGEQTRREAHLRASSVEQIRDALEQARTNPGNLQQFFDHLARICGGRPDCHDLLDEALQGMDPAWADMLRRIAERLPAYTEQMQATRMSMELSPRERYETIHRLRENMLGAEETEAMFGQERAFAEFRFGLGELASEASRLDLDQRRDALEALRAETFADYAEALQGEEGPFGRYQHDLIVMLEGVDDPHLREQLTREVRSWHLDAETIVRLEQRDVAEAEQQQLVASYQEAADAVRQEMETLREGMEPELWQQLYQQRMTELRREYFD